MVTKMELWELDEQGYHLVVKGRVNGQPVRFLLDTGANHICFDRQFVEETLQEQSSVVGHDEINVGIGGNDFETSIIHISGLKIGRMKFKEMDVRVLDLSAKCTNRSVSNPSKASLAAIFFANIRRLSITKPLN